MKKHVHVIITETTIKEIAEEISEQLKDNPNPTTAVDGPQVYYQGPDPDYRKATFLYDRDRLAIFDSPEWNHEDQEDIMFHPRYGINQGPEAKMLLNRLIVDTLHG